MHFRHKYEESKLFLKCLKHIFLKIFFGFWFCVLTRCRRMCSATGQRTGTNWPPYGAALRALGGARECASPASRSLARKVFSRPPEYGLFFGGGGAPVAER